ncbi:MAG: carboxypeptidase regulatory-like domain-containing protein [Planctomycetes bacterium]|nr:carboxypeptidase regulatory-like domain-containing protein [Planctomycetota bacterium]
MSSKRVRMGIAALGILGLGVFVFRGFYVDTVQSPAPGIESRVADPDNEGVGPGNNGNHEFSVTVHIEPPDKFSADAWRVACISPSGQVTCSELLRQPVVHLVAATRERKGMWTICAGRSSSREPMQWHQREFQILDVATEKADWILRIDQTANINGVVQAESGDPQANQSLTCALTAGLTELPLRKAYKLVCGGDGRLDLRTDIAGRFEIRGVPAEMRISFSLSQDDSTDGAVLFETDMPNAGPLKDTFLVSDSRGYSIVIRRSPSCTVRLVVTDEHGASVPGATAVIAYERADLGSVWIDRDVRSKQEEGGYLFSLRASYGTSRQSLHGRRFWGAAFAQDGRAAFGEGIIQDRSVLELVLDSSAVRSELKGRVTDVETGKPLRGVAVNFGHRLARSRKLRTVLTDDEGCFALPDVVAPPPTWLLGDPQLAGYIVWPGLEETRKTIEWHLIAGRPVPESLKFGYPATPGLAVSIELKR